MKTVFLGGTCNNSTWRNIIIPQLVGINAFNPVVEDWTPDCQAEERKQREECDYCLYVITPKMMGVYSIAEAVDDSNKRPDKTLFCFFNEDGGQEFSQAQKKSLIQVGLMVARNGGKWLDHIQDVAEFLNRNV
jgi:Nucleoside 2-deoxyribosyltransferase like